MVAGLPHLMFPAVRVEIRSTSEPFTRHRARTIVVGNVGFLQAGLPLLPDAIIDDGRIDVVLVNPARFLHWLLVVVRVVSRGKKLDETVNRMTGRKVVIRPPSTPPGRSTATRSAPARSSTCECLPGKLLVRVPRWPAAEDRRGRSRTPTRAPHVTRVRTVIGPRPPPTIHSAS